MHIYMNPYVFVAGARLPKGRVRRKDKYTNKYLDIRICMSIYICFHMHAHTNINPTVFLSGAKG